MKIVQIISCENPVYWYNTMVGEIYRVTEDPEYPDDWIVVSGPTPDGYFGVSENLLTKCDVEEIGGEDTLINYNCKKHNFG